MPLGVQGAIRSVHRWIHPVAKELRNKVVSDGLGCIGLARHPAQCASDQIEFHTIRGDGGDS